MPEWRTLGAPPAPILRQGKQFRGVLALRQPARIDGRLRGEVISSGPLWIGESGRVEARVEADELVVAGRLEGSAEARRIELLASARVRAELVTPRLVLAEGCVLEGSCRSDGDGERAAFSP